MIMKYTALPLAIALSLSLGACGPEEKTKPAAKADQVVPITSKVVHRDVTEKAPTLESLDRRLTAVEERNNRIDRAIEARRKTAKAQTKTEVAR